MAPAPVRPAWRERQVLLERQVQPALLLRVYQEPRGPAVSRQERRALPGEAQAFLLQLRLASPTNWAPTRVVFQPHSSRRWTLSEELLSPPPVCCRPAAVADLVS